MANYVVMFFNNKYMKDVTFSQYHKHTYRYKYDPVTKTSVVLSDEEVKIERKKRMEEQIERHTTLDINEARLFSNKNAASCAAARSGYKRANGDFTLIPVEIIPRRIVPASPSE